MNEKFLKFADSLKKSGLRLTATRTEICKLLSETSDHPSALEIYRELKSRYPSLSLATVYNTMDVLVEMGLIRVLGCVGGGHVHIDTNTHSHINVMCMSCHKIIDLPSDEIENLDRRITNESGFKLQGSSIIFYGLCPDCQKKKNSESPAKAQGKILKRKNIRSKNGNTSSN
jgi:Fur family peroxide stress response transcriptional regulator